jgi:hypothetical protein
MPRTKFTRYLWTTQPKNFFLGPRTRDAGRGRGGDGKAWTDMSSVPGLGKLPGRPAQWEPAGSQLENSFEQ